MPRISRRLFLGSVATLAACPLSAKEPVSIKNNDWHEVTRVARSLDQCRAIAIYQNGEQSLFELLRGTTFDQTVPIKSVSKTVVAALAGAAYDRGEIPSVDATIAELAPDLIPSKADPLVGTISIKNLLTMQAGLEPTSGASYGNWISSGNWVANALSRPIVSEPGTRMLYSTGTSHVLGAILSKVSGKSLLTLARERIGQPLGFGVPSWTRDPQGRYLGGNEMALSIPAMISFGEMFRNNGRANNLQVLSETWVKQSRIAATRSMFSGLGYGYGWFLGNRNGTSYTLARGYGGQIICIVPDLALTLVIVSDPARPARTGGYFGDLMRLIEELVIPIAYAGINLGQGRKG